MFQSWCTASLLEAGFAFPCNEQHEVCLIYSVNSISMSYSMSGSSGTFAGSARWCKRWTSFQCRFKDSPFTWRQTWYRDAFGFLVQMADQIDRSTIIIVKCEAKFPVKKPDIMETSQFFEEEVNLFRGAVKCARFCSSSLFQNIFAMKSLSRATSCRGCWGVAVHPDRRHPARTTVICAMIMKKPVGQTVRCERSDGLTY
jgi:hypothetical protein